MFIFLPLYQDFRFKITPYLITFSFLNSQTVDINRLFTSLRILLSTLVALCLHVVDGPDMSHRREYCNAATCHCRDILTRLLTETRALDRARIGGERDERTTDTQGRGHARMQRYNLSQQLCPRRYRTTRNIARPKPLHCRQAYERSIAFRGEHDRDICTSVWSGQPPTLDPHIVQAAAVDITSGSIVARYTYGVLA